MTRTGVRNAFATVLNGLSAFDYTSPAGEAGHNVFKARLNLVPEERLPAAMVYFDQEDVEAQRKGTSGRTLRRDATLLVEIMKAGAVTETEEQLEAALDALSDTVEHAIAADNTLGGAVRAAELTNVSYDRDQAGDGETNVMTAVLTYAVWYETTEGS